MVIPQVARRTLRSAPGHWYAGIRVSSDEREAAAASYRRLQITM